MPQILLNAFQFVTNVTDCDDMDVMGFREEASFHIPQKKHYLCG